jgi:predicted RNA binding protein YcfA (HicA-like mRNA interferase family)
MKIPRDLNGTELTKALGRLGYEISRQKGSHMRITTLVHGEHHEVIPAHKPLKHGTLSAILKSIAHHHNTTVPELLNLLDL